MTQKYVISPSWQNDVIEAQYGTLPSGDNNSIDSAGIAFDNLQNLLNRSIAAGSTFNVPMISTYTLGAGSTLPEPTRGVIGIFFDHPGSLCCPW